jgi:hypothetical protein
MRIHVLAKGRANIRGTEMSNQPARHEFTAVIEGIDLSSEMVDSVTRSVQKAVLTELAGVDLQGSAVLQLPSDRDPTRGGTRGIVIRSGESRQ